MHTQLSESLRRKTALNKVDTGASLQEIEWEDVALIDLAREQDQCRVAVGAVMIPRAE
jgi:hypothetical protein